MQLAFLVLLAGGALVLVSGVAAMIYEFQMRKHGLARGATEKQLEDLHATLTAVQERLEGMEEHMADQVLDAQPPDELPRGR